ncbi:MAG TPA: stage III sporulation protein AF, partial [Thermoanaerobacterales bacterium]|nr:stage III sporulation protein AF [Thermoanaerobacterales bacterium]
MLNTINLWIKQIVMVVVFAAFIDFLIPENKFLKYIKVFLGLLVMIAIVNPLVPLLQKGVSIDIEIPQGYKNFVNKSGIKHDSEVLNKTNNKLTIVYFSTC